MKYLSLLSAITVFVVAMSMGQTPGSERKPICLNLALGHGFLDTEPIIVSMHYSNRDTVVFSGELVRTMWVDDTNFFEIPLEAGKVDKLTVECTARGVVYTHLFLFHHSDAYLELGVDMRNEIHPMSRDVPSVRE